MTASEPYGSGFPLVFDTSAWTRSREPDVVSRWTATLNAGLLLVCPVVALEVLATSRNEASFRALDRTFSALKQAPVTATSCRAAIGAARELGASRRIPAADYLVAAAAAERGCGVLHCDTHFDLLCGALGVESVWAK